MKLSEKGKRPYPLDKERRRRVMIALAERDMNITDLAKALHISQQYTSCVVIGRDLSAKTEQRIAEYLDKPVDYLFPPRTAKEINKMRQAETIGKKK